jgi:hypothetical protein
VWGLEVLGKCFVAWPEFRKPNETWIKGIFGNIVGDAPIIFVCGIYQCLEMRKNFGHLIWRKPKYSEYGNHWVHVVS